MSHEARLSRLGLSHLADKPEELSKELDKRIAVIREQEKAANERHEARLKLLESMTPEQRAKDEADRSAAFRAKMQEMFHQQYSLPQSLAQ